MGVLVGGHPFTPLRAFALLAVFFFAILNKADLDIHVQLRFRFSEMSAQGQRVLTLNKAAGENKMFLVPESQEKCLLSKGGKSRKNETVCQPPVLEPRRKSYKLCSLVFPHLHLSTLLPCADANRDTNSGRKYNLGNLHFKD